MTCKWSIDEVCQTLVEYPTGKPLACNGHHAVCQGQAGKVRDTRDGAFQLPLLSEEKEVRDGIRAIKSYA